MILLTPSTTAVTFENVTVGKASLDSQYRTISPYYGYMPTKWIGILFTVLFLLTTALHIGQTVFYRVWWCYPTIILACCGEILGWACRVWSFHSPMELTPYLVQTVALIISPTPLIGALFIMFGRISARLRVGQHRSRLSPKLYARVFISADVCALLVQSIGGGIAASSSTTQTTQLGGHIILAGVVFQLASLTLFCVLLGEYYIRCLKTVSLHSLPKTPNDDVVTIFKSLGDYASPLVTQLYVGVGLATMLLYIRAVYRTVELADGLGGSVVRTETLFVGLDGVMVLLAMLILNVCHPGRFPDARAAEDKESEQLGSQDSEGP